MVNLGRLLNTTAIKESCQEMADYESEFPSVKNRKTSQLSFSIAFMFSYAIQKFSMEGLCSDLYSSTLQVS